MIMVSRSFCFARAALHVLNASARENKRKPLYACAIGKRWPFMQSLKRLVVTTSRRVFGFELPVNGQVCATDSLPDTTSATSDSSSRRKMAVRCETSFP